MKRQKPLHKGRLKRKERNKEDLINVSKGGGKKK